jgi:hypothetical protein
MIISYDNNFEKPHKSMHNSPIKSISPYELCSSPVKK